MGHRSWRWMLLAMVVAAGCDPNPNGPSAPASPDAGRAPNEVLAPLKAKAKAAQLRVPD